jgi:drug/metabolite transporter (DMT)-like permease
VTWRIWLAFSALGLIWGLPYFFIKLALADLSPAVVAWSRVTLGALILLPLAWHRGALESVGRHKGTLVVFAVLEMVVPFFLMGVGETWISSSLAGILIATVPVQIILLSPLFGLRETLGRRRIIGLLTGFLGVIVLLGIGSDHGLMAWVGVACVLLGGLGYATAAVIVQKHLADADELGAVAVSLAIASVVLLPLAAMTAPAHWPTPISLLSVAVLGVACTAAAMLLYFYLVTRAGASRAAVITYINPAVATLLGVGVLHEAFGVASAVGLALILLGSWLSTSHAGAVAPESELGAAG